MQQLLCSSRRLFIYLWISTLLLKADDIAGDVMEKSDSVFDFFALVEHFSMALYVYTSANDMNIHIFPLFMARL